MLQVARLPRLGISPKHKSKLPTKTEKYLKGCFKIDKIDKIPLRTIERVNLAGEQFEIKESESSFCESNVRLLKTFLRGDQRAWVKERI